MARRIFPESTSTALGAAGLFSWPRFNIRGKNNIPRMIATSTIREYIREPDKTIMIRQAIQEGFVQYQMQTFDQALMQLYKEQKITLEAATRASSNPHEFQLRIKGIQASSDNTWNRFEDATEEPTPELQHI